ncbi:MULTISPECIES: hypothetical protein [Sulfolobaceae]|uniref:Uncharacterized protein n=1 Tax=Sulfurisphaera ohwakuensis TaxID=69656 RepID=A0A650CI13_SULOH|nr:MULTISPECIES: hypothetical protein [Sulfolobaceae]MBB5252353.1 hypothetical protein [Sulfurisphaera ohwakuensis]QGR17187.1 hypothetical protein D1869_08295 [Sulfurisphaera ohwakuensis]QIW24355.1 hypothetical protein EWF20_09465 [Sulfolobus sp. S-194]
MTRMTMKGRDIESLLFMGKIKSVNVEYCDESKKMAKVVVETIDGDIVETECIATRAAGKISVVIKHYLRMGVDKLIIQDNDISNVKNVDTEVEEDEVQDRQDT